MSHQGLENYGLPLIVTYSFASDSPLQTADTGLHILETLCTRRTRGTRRQRSRPAERTLSPPRIKGPESAKVLQMIASAAVPIEPITITLDVPVHRVERTEPLSTLHSPLSTLHSPLSSVSVNSKEN